METNPFMDDDFEEADESEPDDYLEELPAWEYQLVVRDLELDNAPGKDELDPLGADGWEMIGVVVHANMLYCYFKRQV